MSVVAKDGSDTRHFQRGGVRPGGGRPGGLVLVLVLLVLFAILSFWAGTTYLGFWLWLPLGRVGSFLLFGALITLTVALPAGLVVTHRKSNRLGCLVGRSLYTVMGAYVYLFLTANLLSLGYLFNWLLGDPGGLFAEGATVASLALIAVVAIVIIGLIRARSIRINHVTIPTAGIDRKLRLVVISDTHIGPILGRDYLDRVTRMTAAQRPDLILAVGDIVDIHPDHLAAMRGTFKRLFAVAPSYVVTGNHEYINGEAACMAFLQSVGAVYLSDEVRTDMTTGLTLVGLEDPMGNRRHGPRPRAMSRLMEEAQGERPIIVLSHQPVAFDIAAAHGALLMVSGHTHGGQLWPFNLLTRLIYGRYHVGLSRLGASYLYTSSGTGTWGPPMRIGTHSELVVVDLVPET